MINEQANRMNQMQQNWAKNGLPESAGRIGGASVGFNSRFSAIKSGALRDTFQKFNNFNTNTARSSSNGMPQVRGAGAVAFQALPEPKVGRDKRMMGNKNSEVKKVEVATFTVPKIAQGNSELSQIESLFGGGSRGAYYGGTNHGQGHVPQMAYNPNNEINLDNMYAQKGGDHFDPRSLILQRQQAHPQQNQITGYNPQPQTGYNPMVNEQPQYGNFHPQQQPMNSEFMQYSMAGNQMNPSEQMAEIARAMATQVLEDYKKQEKKNQILTSVRHISYDNLVKDFNGQLYLMEFDDKNYMVLKPVKTKK